MRISAASAEISSSMANAAGRLPPRTLNPVDALPASGLVMLIMATFRPPICLMIYLGKTKAPVVASCKFAHTTGNLISPVTCKKLSLGQAKSRFPGTMAL